VRGLRPAQGATQDRHAAAVSAMLGGWLMVDKLRAALEQVEDTHAEASEQLNGIKGHYEVLGTEEMYGLFWRVNYQLGWALKAINDLIDEMAWERGG
jgi:hypothetical protein